ncbi:MAG: hypothetical protein L0H31_02240 [Nocardioidaceae bacterium]|nr:hypothetical protein [Nocardioidaceae bacterium]
MDASELTPGRVPQRALVTGAPGVGLDTFVRRLAEVLDAPLVLPTDLSEPTDLDTLAAFDGWVTSTDAPAAREVLLGRAEIVVQVLPEVGALRSLVRRTVRKLRAEAAESDAWVDELALTHPELRVARVTGEAEATIWLNALLTD